MMKILITGASGLLGEKVANLAPQHGLEVYGSYKDNPTSLENSINLDLADKDAIISVSKKVKPDVIMNCAALTDVDLCEQDKDLAMEVNAEVPLYLAEASNTVGAHLVHVSTDYVFDGKKGMYSEDDEPNPINLYGSSKLLGEKNVASTARSWCVARTSVVFGWGREKRPNYATWIIRGLREQKRLNVVTDQFASPTLNTNLAAMLLEVTEQKLQGLIHLAGGNRIDRFTMATKIADVFNLDKTFLTPVGSGSINWLARRPKDSSLNVSKATEELETKPLGLDKALIEMKATENME
ncbi:dTDP-4-dehydrorhamnose reductase [Candidatus Bathyarchaeota archaeon]|nr:dTDP-4-dehydrorhamnose reductase [Candidatus Bathyarchaeota archaeon]